MEQITFDTNIFLHNLDIIKNYTDYKRVVLLPVIAELDNIKVNSQNGMLKHKGRMATRKLIKMIDEGEITPLISDFTDNEKIDKEVRPLSKYELIDDLIIFLCKENGIKLVTMDFNVVLKCKHVGVEVELIKDEMKIENLSMVYKGVQEVYTTRENVDILFKNKSIKIDLLCQDIKLNENECVTLINAENPSCKAMSIYQDGVLKQIPFSDKKYWGLSPRSLEQRYALALLDNDDIKIVSLTGKAGASKAQPNDTKIPTPKGWTTMGQLKVGDEVFDRKGQPTKVLGVYPQGVKPTYKFTFSDGRSTLCSDEHLWDIYTQKTKYKKRTNKKIRPMTMNTLEVIEKMEKLNKGNTGREKPLFIQSNKCVNYSKKELPIPPYALGALLGDGCLTCSGLQMSSDEEDVVAKVSQCLNLEYKFTNGNNYTWNFSTIKTENRKWKKALDDFGLLTTSFYKHIPQIYLESDKEDRLALLHGLMDTDGSVGKKNRFSFSTVSPKLKDDFIELCRSLGYITGLSVTHENARGRKNALYEISIQTNDKIFTSKKHTERYNNNINKFKETIGKYYNDFLRIVSIEKVKEQECTCIYVDNDEHLYLTNDFIVTHNTILAFAVGLEKNVNASTRKGKLYIAKPPVSLSKKLALGFKKGTTIDKAMGSLGSYSTNLERLSTHDDGRNDGRKMLESLMEQCKVVYLNLEDILGMSFNANDYIIIDEAELLTKDEMKAILTRGGKMVVIGDCDQKSENSGVDYENSGLLHLIEVGKQSKLIAHLTLEQIYRDGAVAEINEIW